MAHFLCPFCIWLQRKFIREATVDLSKDLHKKFGTWCNANYPTGVNESQWREIMEHDAQINYAGDTGVIEAVRQDENEDADVTVAVLQAGHGGMEDNSQGEQCMCMDLQRQFLHVYLCSLNACIVRTLVAAFTAHGSQR